MSKFAHPEALKLRKNYTYRLVATVNHFGSLGFGHHTAICKRPVDHNREKWFEFDDLHVREQDGWFAVQRDAAGFIFELIEDEKFDRAEQLESCKNWIQVKKEKIKSAKDSLRKA